MTLARWLVAAACTLTWGAAAAAMAQAPPVTTSSSGDAVVTSLTVFAGSPSGLWRSRDWGRTWQRAEGRLPGETLEGLGAVHQIMALGMRVLMATDSGLWVSQDFGQSWKRQPLAARLESVLFSRFPESDPTVFVGAADGLHKSVDGGRTFRPAGISGTAVHELEWPGPTLVVATPRGLLVSEDGGESFTPRSQGLPEGDVKALAISSYYAVDPIVFVGVGAEGIFRSGDGGRTWARSGLEGHIVNDLLWFGPRLFAATHRGVWRSDDSGKTWEGPGTGMKGRQAVELLFPLAPTSTAEVFLATDDGVFRSIDAGRSWVASGLQGEPVLTLATFPPPDTTVSPKKKK